MQGEGPGTDSVTQLGRSHPRENQGLALGHTAGV